MMRNSFRSLTHPLHSLLSEAIVPIQLGQQVDIPENVDEIRLTYVGSLAIPHIYLGNIVDVINMFFHDCLGPDETVTRNDIASITMSTWLKFDVTLKDGRTIGPISDLVDDVGLSEALDRKRGFAMSHWVKEDGSMEEIEQNASEEE